MHHRRFLRVLVLTAVSCLFFAGVAGAASPSLNVIYSFTNGFTVNSGVVRAANGSFYGVTATGGPSNNGGVFVVTSNGVLTNLYWFNGANGATPMGPLLPDGLGHFYGTASRGGASNEGTIFEVVTGGIQLLASFSGTNGSNPQGPLLKGTNGWYYGTTFNGGGNSEGSVFSFNTAGVLSNNFSFGTGANVGAGQGLGGGEGSGEQEGSNPSSGLIQGTNGNLYGTTTYGGDSGFGTVFELTYSNTLNTIGALSSRLGAFPGGLTADTNGHFYGTAINGGADFQGTIFEATSNNVEPFATFGVTNGANPNYPLAVASEGNWYGTTEQGGAFGRGIIFLLNDRGFMANVFSFAGTNGAWPRSGLMQGGDGNYYGTTSAGGAYGFGEIYQLAGFAPYIIAAPTSLAYVSNRTATFTVTAGGTAPLSYQWMFDGTNAASDIPGATNASLVLSNEQLINSGTYTVIISNAFGAVSAGAVLTVVAPTVTIAAVPATVTNAALTFTGKASDPNGIASVSYQLNSNGWITVSGTTSWQASVTLQPGENTFQAESFDPLGNPSAIKSASVFYSVVSPLTLQTTGLGSVSTNFKGPNLIIGRSYLMTADPAKGWLFSNWTGTVTVTNNPLSFVMQANMVETANFVTNPFIAAAANYAGLFYADNGVAEQSAGLVSSLLVKTTGAYSGQIVLQGVAYGFTGAFNVSQQSSTTIARAAAHGGPVTLQLTLSGEVVTGTISGTNSGGWISSLTAERVTAPVGSAQYTLLIPSQQDVSPNSPPGDGYVLVTNHNGSVTLSGALADGATLSQKTSIVGNGDVPFYVSLYSNTGLLLGWLNISDGLTANALWWVKPATNGFTNIITDVLTSAWTEPPVSYLTDGALTISNATLSLDYTVSIAKTALVEDTSGPNPTNSLSGVFYPATGLLKITFGNGVSKSTTIGYAAILGDSTNGGGYFLTKTNAGAITLLP